VQRPEKAFHIVEYSLASLANSPISLNGNEGRLSPKVPERLKELTNVVRLQEPFRTVSNQKWQLVKIL
jgi:hypothetical protein